MKAGVISFRAVALENIPAGANVQIEIDAPTGSMRVRCLRIEDLTEAIEDEMPTVLAELGIKASD